MVANVLKKGSFVIGEMVVVVIFITNQSHKAVCPTLFISIFFAGRGVDLNRNWSVDWGKKEKVSVSVVSLCTGET
uniref:Uncharacterized protein n=1 Tax=Arundo donax TaxID=35708 RepID=A0A0A9EQB1_ARUDO